MKRIALFLLTNIAVLVVISIIVNVLGWTCLLYTSPSPRDRQKYRMPSSA